MSDQTQLPVEQLYELTLQVTRVVEYGASLEALTSGQAAPPAEGARFDVYFEGPVTGTKVSGSLTGVDYLYLRADGRLELHVHAEITTDDGARIAVAADGVAMGEAPVLQLRESVTLRTCHPEYSWVNPIQVWARGTVDLAKGEIRLAGYAA